MTFYVLAGKSRVLAPSFGKTYNTLISLQPCFDRGQ
jgi:hypothetical protein